MSSEYIGANYNLAKAEADKIDAEIIETLKSGHSFRVEAGAGSGKTYSLNRAIEWIQANKWSDYSRKKTECGMYYLYKCSSRCDCRATCKRFVYSPLHNPLFCMECYQTVSECFGRCSHNKS